MTALLDVNVLVALAWPNHIHHEPARSWFEEQRSKGWATCSITENAFVRISSNPAVVDEARTPLEAVILLRRLVGLGGHRFWEDDVSIARAEESELHRMHGYRQVLDVHLLRLAQRHRGRLATFDRKIAALLPEGEERRARLLVLD